MGKEGEIEMNFPFAGFLPRWWQELGSGTRVVGPLSTAFPGISVGGGLE